MIDISITKHLSSASIHNTDTLEIDIQIKSGSFVGLSGVSGAGKTSLLRVIAGLDDADGSIVVDGKHWLGRGKP